MSELVANHEMLYKFSKILQENHQKFSDQMTEAHFSQGIKKDWGLMKNSSRYYMDKEGFCIRI